MTTIPMASAPVPALVWGGGLSAPTQAPVAGFGPSNLPPADIIAIAWTDAEWSALDFVFRGSAAARTPKDMTFDTAWVAYSHNVGSYTTDAGFPPLWGSFQLVTVTGASGKVLSVLLFKSNTHFAHNPYAPGLRVMVQNLLADTGAKCVMSTGTAGGGRVDQKLGDAVITCGAFLQPTSAGNPTDPANGWTFTSPYVPNNALAAAAQGMMFPLAQVATADDMATIFALEFTSPGTLTVSDLIDGPLQNLTSPTLHVLPGVPLNTSDNYGMAPAGGSPVFSCYEEDDAIIAAVAAQLGVAYVSARNVSDTVVAGTTQSGNPISEADRNRWADALYDRYQFHTAVNGAIAAVAIITAGG